jgi:hypothetical protein
MLALLPVTVLVSSPFLTFSLQELDISDLGASPESILLFLRNFISYGDSAQLKRLVIFGRQPFAGKNVRGYCTPEFLRRVKVS